MDITELKNGIWNLITKIDTKNFNFKKEGFKSNYPISQLISPLKDNNIFSFKIKRQLYCYNCFLKDLKEEFYGPIIQINLDDLNLNFSDCLYKRFENKTLICPK